MGEGTLAFRHISLKTTGGMNKTKSRPVHAHAMPFTGATWINAAAGNDIMTLSTCNLSPRFILELRSPTAHNGTGLSDGGCELQLISSGSLGVSHKGVPPNVLQNLNNLYHTLLYFYFYSTLLYNTILHCAILHSTILC